MTEIQKFNIKLMAEFFCHPLWSNVSPYNVDPADLPLSSGLQKALSAWAKQYDDILDLDDPASACFPTAEAAAAFKVEGTVLLDRLQAELGNQFRVTFRFPE